MEKLAEQMRQMSYLSTHPFDLINYKEFIRNMKMAAKKGKYSCILKYEMCERQHENDLTQYVDKFKEEGFEVEYTIGSDIRIKW